MVHVVQHSAGAGRRSKRMAVGVVLWFLGAGLIRGALSSVADEGKATVQNSTKRAVQDTTLYKKNKDSSSNRGENAASVLHRASRELPQAKDGNGFLFGDAANEGGISEAIKKLPVKSKSFFVIPYFRPGRSDNKDMEKRDFDTVIPMARFGRSASDMGNVMADTKRYETIIPVVRFGRNGGKRRSDNSNSVIPYPRLGRSSPTDVESSFVEVSEDDYFETSDEESEGKDENEIRGTSLAAEKRDDHDTIIPYPRTGRQESDGGREDKRSDYDYVLPQMRYGRRTDVTTGESTKQSPHTFVLPYPRPGRSSRNMQVVFPYPQEFDSNEESINWDKRQANYMLPFARLGRPAAKIHSQSKEGSNSNDLLNDPGVNSLKAGQKNSPEKLKEVTADTSSVFMIPYPRPGKKSLLAIAGSQGKQKQNKEVSDYVLPYPRPGKKSSAQPSPKNFKNPSDAVNENARQFMVPYPRPGRSGSNQFRSITDGKYQQNEDIAYDFLLGEDEHSKLAGTEDYLRKISKRSENMFMVPYARLGKRAETAVADANIDRYADDEMGLDYGVSDYESYITEEDFSDLHGHDTSHLRYKRSNSVVPYPRLGRSEMIIPYPRIGKSDSIVPYPRPGRSNFVIPHPRIGRSTSVVPYPRPGRSNSVIPYPRIGRSNSVLPYPRLGRSDSVVPYPRLGRSNYLVPYPRPGRSDSVVPYPRLGRSDSVVPYPRPGRSDSIVPYPRPGRSDSSVPILRLRKTSSLLPYPRPGRSNSVVPYPRLGRSNSFLALSRSRRSPTVVPYPRLGRSTKEPKPLPKYGNWILPNIRPGRSVSYEDEVDITPYLNPGRFQAEFLQGDDSDSPFFANRHNTDTTISYPKLGQPGYLVSNQRSGRSSSVVQYSDGANNIDTVIPYPRLGRSQEQVTHSPELPGSPHKLNKHMLTKADDSIYLLPYPRPGRYSE